MIIADTGFWLALANQKDRWHKASCHTLETLEEDLITTWPVMTETCHLLLQRLGTKALLAFIQSFQKGAFSVYTLNEQAKEKLYGLMQKYQDLPMDLADASLVLLAEELGHGRILSTDQRDFQTYRWKQRAPFENLLTRSCK